MSIDYLNPGSVWVGGEPQKGAVLIPWATIDPIHARFAMLFEKNGLNVVFPDFIMPKFELEPFTREELLQIWGYKRANIYKLRSIIRKAKNTWH